ncbi:junB proto-oncogene, AP-1 transcription factor subunit a [Polyodon spathula]|uniref:junB proto-oncogene, AP-1 transcription factor subunit a n=1 Tax=Polyodon spathula TaxID=7913 RepID=UPI001B7F4228|nr:junB proto-oncogene, AP-1 transcription factor subunit a [Polyodon spathula]
MRGFVLIQNCADLHQAANSRIAYSGASLSSLFSEDKKEALQHCPSLVETERYLAIDSALQDYKLMKQNMSLNLSDPYRNLKSHLRADRGGFYTASQDVGSLKLASPELERLIIQNSNGVITTTPTPGQYFYARGITEEQEGFADGFVKALDELHQINQMAPPNVSIGAGGVTTCSAPSSVYGSSLQPDTPVYTNLNSYSPSTSLTAPSNFPTATISYLPHHHHQHGTAHHFQHSAPPGPAASALHPHRLVSLKEEPQTVPDFHSSDDSPSVSPIDMENQEVIKAERKRLRNRQAATKCRRRKLERIARLEEKVKALKSDNAGLSSTATVLRDQVAQLKQKVMTHVSSGCQLMLTSKMQSF